MTPDVDVAILGAGCAGLSLAVALAERAPALRVQLVESRRIYHRDHTWCFWDTASHPFAPGVTHRWSSWRVRQGTTEVQQRSERYTYQHLPADRFYELALNKVRRAGHALEMGVTVGKVTQDHRACQIQTDQGSLQARWVFDSRPFAPGATRPVLLQRFLGWHIRCAEPCFDPTVVDLMDFQAYAGDGRIVFFYVLPFSETEALVEATFLDQPGFPAVEAAFLLNTYMHQRCTGTHEVLYQESASLPMGDWCPRPAPRGRLVAIGTRGGRVKASSGYAFQRIQRQSRALAEALAGNRHMPQAFEPVAYKVLDRIFLKALLRAPERAAGYFMTMFQKVPPNTLVRFLSETASGHEVLQTMLILPKMDFLKAGVLPARKGSAA